MSFFQIVAHRRSPKIAYFANHDPSKMIRKGLYILNLSVRMNASFISYRQRFFRSKLMVLEGLDWFELKKCISLESFQSTKVFIFRTPRAVNDP